MKRLGDLQEPQRVAATRARAWGVLLLVVCACSMHLPSAALSQEISVEAPGLRFSPLNNQEVSALRRTVKLPLSAIFAADSVRDLSQQAIVLPLPDPNRPFLPVQNAGAGDGDPFAAKDTRSVRGGALAELFAIEATITKQRPATTSTKATTARDEDSNPFAAESEGSEPAAAAEEPVEEETLSDDPFADF